MACREGGKEKAGRMLAMLEPLYDCPGGFGIPVYFYFGLAAKPLMTKSVSLVLSRDISTVLGALTSLLALFLTITYTKLLQQTPSFQ